MPSQRSRSHISRLAFMLAGLLITVTAISLIFVGFVASRASQQQAIANEKMLFQSALDEQFRTIVREQISVTSSDRSVSKLVRNFDPDYARQSFNMLWNNYRHSKLLFVSNQGHILAESFENYTHITKQPLSDVPEIVPVVSSIQDLFRQNRVRVPGGFGHRTLQGLDPSEFARMGFIQLDGKPALYGAMPIIPEEYGVTLPDGGAAMLISAYYVDDFLLDRLNAHLRFSAFTFQPGRAAPPKDAKHTVYAQNGDLLGYFSWESQAKGSTIWPTVIPVIAFLSLALAVLAFGIAWRIGQLTTSLQSSEAQNRYLALHDSLSGLANRLQFNRVLENAVKDLPLKAFAVLHCDLDKFKAVNDTYGHAAGDTVIKTVADRMTEVVGGPGLVCRVGGDEFMIIYRASTDKLELQELSRSLIDTIKRPIPLSEGLTAEIGLSIGISLAPTDGREPEELVAQSDEALYRAKELGRGRYHFYSDLPGDSFLPGSGEDEFENLPAAASGSRGQ